MTHKSTGLNVVEIVFLLQAFFLNWLTRAMHGRIILHWWYNDYQWCRYYIYVYRSANCCTPPSNDNATPPRSLVVVKWVFLANSIRRNSNIATRVVLEQLPGLAATMEGIRKGPLYIGTLVLINITTFTVSFHPSLYTNAWVIWLCQAAWTAPEGGPFFLAVLVKWIAATQ